MIDFFLSSSRLFQFLSRLTVFTLYFILPLAFAFAFAPSIDAHASASWPDSCTLCIVRIVHALSASIDNFYKFSFEI
jgi:hypothetical protein